MKTPKWKSIRAFRKDLVKIGDLAQSHYGIDEDTAHAEYLSHEYFQNPNGDAVIQIAWNEEKEEAGGQFALIPRKIKIGTRTALMLKSVNTITRSEYRGQGVFTTLARDVLHEVSTGQVYALSEGMPNQNSHPGFVGKLGYHDLGFLPLYLRALRPSRLIRDYLHAHALSFLAKPFDRLFSCKRPPGSPQGISFVRLTRENLSLADNFWEKIQHKYPVMFSRDSAFLQWRFLDNPRRKYECWFAVKDGEPVAYTIGRVMTVSGMSCAMIGDFLFLNGFELPAKSLLKHLVFLLQQQGGDLAGCLMQAHAAEARILRSLGFFRCPKFLEPQPFCVILRMFDTSETLKPALDFKNWFYTMGDNDII